MSCIARERVRGSSIRDDARIELRIVRCRDDQRCILQIAWLVRALHVRATVIVKDGTHAIVDPFGNDEDWKPGSGNRFSLSCRDIASTHDYGSASVWPERDWEHTNAQRVPRPAAKNRLVTGRYR